MGLPILEVALKALRKEGFSADAAYPGQKYPPITETVAAVHIAQVDRADMTVTVEVTVISPASLGGTECETEALRATEALRWAGADCVQKGCQYDGMAQVYCVDILATFTGIAEEESCTLGPGYAVYVGEDQLEFVTSFTAEETWDVFSCYVIGEDYPADIGVGEHGWEITIEERIPTGSDEVEYGGAIVNVSVERFDGHVECYRTCRFSSVKREFVCGALKRTWKGKALKKGVRVTG